MYRYIMIKKKSKVLYGIIFLTSFKLISGSDSLAFSGLARLGVFFKLLDRWKKFKLFEITRNGMIAWFIAKCCSYIFIFRISAKSSFSSSILQSFTWNCCINSNSLALLNGTFHFSSRACRCFRVLVTVMDILNEYWNNYGWKKRIKINFTYFSTLNLHKSCWNSIFLLKLIEIIFYGKYQIFRFWRIFFNACLL